MDTPNDASLPDRSELTFAQAEGAAPLPSQLTLKQVSAEMAAKLWVVIYTYMQSAREYPFGASQPYLTEPWKTIMYDWHVVHEHKLADEFQTSADVQTSYAKSYITRRNYIETFEFLQFVIRHRLCPFKLPDQINLALKSSRAAYRVIGKTIVPVASPEEASTIERAFLDVKVSKYEGAQAHLKDAASALNAGAYADSIRHSIHAVESVARKLEPNAATLTPALATLAKTGKIHGSLREGFGKLYGYTSDAEGVRHALIEGASPEVDEADAVYMFGACAAFVSYLIKKGGQETG